MFSVFFNFQNIRYTMYLGIFLFFFRKEKDKKLEYHCEKEYYECDNIQNEDWGQFVNIEWY